jgi:hypothetical protein
MKPWRTQFATNNASYRESRWRGYTVVISANLESTCLLVERRGIQHAIYECLGIGKFPVKEIQEEEGNKQGQREDYPNLGGKGVMPFQCEDCWMYHRRTTHAREA